MDSGGEVSFEKRSEGISPVLLDHFHCKEVHFSEKQTRIVLV